MAATKLDVRVTTDLVNDAREHEEFHAAASTLILQQLVGAWEAAVGKARRHGFSVIAQSPAAAAQPLWDEVGRRSHRGLWWSM